MPVDYVTWLRLLRLASLAAWSCFSKQRTIDPAIKAKQEPAAPAGPLRPTPTNPGQFCCPGGFSLCARRQLFRTLRVEGLLRRKQWITRICTNELRCSRGRGRLEKSTERLPISMLPTRWTEKCPVGTRQHGWLHGA